MIIITAALTGLFVWLLRPRPALPPEARSKPFPIVLTATSTGTPAAATAPATAASAAVAAGPAPSATASLTTTPARASELVRPAPPSGEPVKAFPGAEGFGADTVGGRGGRVIEITNLDDSGPGSLRDCVSADGPRTCVFKVGGTIMLDSEMLVTSPYLTIAGQTAPGGGILLRNNPQANTYTTFEIRTHDVIVRYISVRAGPTSGGGDAVGVSNLDERGVYNVVVDHCSFSWGMDETFSTWRDVHEVSLQWNIFAEGLDCSTHAKGCHSKSVMLGSSSGRGESGLGAYDLSFHHNLIANSHARNPLVKTSGVIDLVNNISYNARGTFSMIDMESKSVVPVNYVNNYFKGGPNTPPDTYGTRVDDSKGGDGVSLYVKGNLAPSRVSDSQPDTDFVDPRSLGFLTDTRHPAAAVTTSSAEESYAQVRENAGNNRGLDAQGRWFARQDAVDQRIIAELQAGEGKVIDAPGASSCPDAKRYPKHACIYLTAADYTRYDIDGSLIAADGWPVIAGGAGYADADQDGMPDAWEKANRLDPNNPADGAQDRNGDGYTNLEAFLNGTAP